MGFIKEFRDFAMRGNVVDLAVGVVIGASFGKIVTSLVNDIIMPPLNLITAHQGINFKEAAYKIKVPKIEKGAEVVDASGAPVLEDYTILNYGPFIQSIVDFVIVAFAIFLFIKLMNQAKKRFEKEQAAAPPAAPAEEVVLLREIRDALQK